ncbi:hypothetical protein O181_022796 [Austropuccinia psidii MF-1]|uniref:Uncharacterized protein n=1 Tax=Austropuccinia psidii MF-1 TaxID=1389203 RepID=A0A9Q3CI68_9BASI|nr:hypothetical protein [Austropuccinia psidii MF-1]
MKTQKLLPQENTTLLKPLTNTFPGVARGGTIFSPNTPNKNAPASNFGNKLTLSRCPLPKAHPSTPISSNTQELLSPCSAIGNFSLPQPTSPKIFHLLMPP